MSKVEKLYEQIESLSGLTPLEKYRMRILAFEVDNAGFVRGFTAGIQEGRDLATMETNSREIVNT